MFFALNFAVWLTDTQMDVARSAANQAPIVNHNLQVDEHDNWEQGK